MKIDSDQCSRSVWALGLLWATCFVSHAHFCFVFQKLAVLKAAFQQDLFQNAKNGFVTRVILHFFCISCHMIDPWDHIRMIRMIRMISSLNKIHMTIGCHVKILGGRKVMF